MTEVLRRFLRSTLVRELMPVGDHEDVVTGIVQSLRVSTRKLNEVNNEANRVAFSTLITQISVELPARCATSLATVLNLPTRRVQNITHFHNTGRLLSRAPRRDTIDLIEVVFVR
jgi:hypothetical protein